MMGTCGMNIRQQTAVLTRTIRRQYAGDRGETRIAPQV